MAGCSNGNCIINKPEPGSVVTNGWCACLQNRSRSQLSLIQSRLDGVLDIEVDDRGIPVKYDSPNTDLLDALEAAIDTMETLGGLSLEITNSKDLLLRRASKCRSVVDTIKRNGN